MQSRTDVRDFVHLFRIISISLRFFLNCSQTES